MAIGVWGFRLECDMIFNPGEDGDDGLELIFGIFGEEFGKFLHGMGRSGEWGGV